MGSPFLSFLVQHGIAVPKWLPSYPVGPRKLLEVSLTPLYLTLIPSKAAASALGLLKSMPATSAGPTHSIPPSCCPSPAQECLTPSQHPSHAPTLPSLIYGGGTDLPSSAIYLHVYTVYSPHIGETQHGFGKMEVSDAVMEVRLNKIGLLMFWFTE